VRPRPGDLERVGAAVLVVGVDRRGAGPCWSRLGPTLDSELEDWLEEVRREGGKRLPVLAVRRPAGRGRVVPTLCVLDEDAMRELAAVFCEKREEKALALPREMKPAA